MVGLGAKMIMRYASGLGFSSVEALRPTTWYWFIFPATVIFETIFRRPEEMNWKEKCERICWKQ